MKDEKTFKSTYDIILGIGEVWEKMSDIDQAALLRAIDSSIVLLAAAKEAAERWSASPIPPDEIANLLPTSLNLSTILIASPAMVELKKVTDGTENQFNTFLKNAKSNAVELETFDRAFSISPINF